MIQYTIHLQPVTKKNSQRLVNIKGRIVPLPSEAYKRYEAQAGQYLRPPPEKPIDYPVEISCVYMLPLNKDGSRPKRQPDLTNLLEATHDVLVKYKIIADDNVSVIVSVDGSRAYYTREDPKTIITITEIDNEETCRDRREGNREDTP